MATHKGHRIKMDGKLGWTTRIFPFSSGVFPVWLDFEQTKKRLKPRFVTPDNIEFVK